ncbi:MAG: hypothetical protein JHC84_01460 [Solirubrobacteraceae bacterium]|nr:hypothetical protein [Solirubrobacteraceae bacterium]
MRWLLRAAVLMLSVLGALFAFAIAIGLSACEVDCEDDLFFGVPWYLIIGPPLLFFFAVLAESAVAGIRRLRSRHRRQ